MKSRPSSDDRRTAAERRRRDRGGRRRDDWPDDSGITACPTCSSTTLQNMGANDLGEYLWLCLACQRRFQSQRASRFIL